MSTRNAMGGHQSAAAKSTVWLTPRPILAALGPFDLDPCAAPDPVRWPTAARHIREADTDGLTVPWSGRVWCNSPYGEALWAWLDKLATHGRGTALLFARTETAGFFAQVWPRASGVLFLEGRLHFHYPFGDASAPCALEAAPHEMIPVGPPVRPGGRQPTACAHCGRADANSGAPSVLAAYGLEDLDRLAVSDLAGALVPLQFPRFAVVEALACSWRDAVLTYVREHRGPVVVSDLYRAFARHPKAKRNPHWRAKLRQTLQRAAGAGLVEHVGPATWAAA